MNEKVFLGETLAELSEQIEAARGYPALGPLLAVVEGLHGVVAKLVEDVQVGMVDPVPAEGAAA